MRTVSTTVEHPRPGRGPARTCFRRKRCQGTCRPSGARPLHGALRRRAGHVAVKRHMGSVAGGSQARRTIGALDLVQQVRDQRPDHVLVCSDLGTGAHCPSRGQPGRGVGTAGGATYGTLWPTLYGEQEHLGRGVDGVTVLAGRAAAELDQVGQDGRLVAAERAAGERNEGAQRCAVPRSPPWWRTGVP